MKLKGSRYLFAIGLIALAASSCHNSQREKERDDSIRMADSIAMVEQIEQARKDSLRLDSVNQLKEALAKFNPQDKKFIFVHKPWCMLYVMEGDTTLMEAKVCLGIGMGQKTRKGDHKTPEGEYKIISIENSTRWPHDFNDGRGPVLGAYGPWFFRWNFAGSRQIGIHGTCFPESVGTRESQGCVRLTNDDLLRLKELVYVGMPVLVSPDPV